MDPSYGKYLFKRAKWNGGETVQLGKLHHKTLCLSLSCFGNFSSLFPAVRHIHMLACILYLRIFWLFSSLSYETRHIQVSHVSSSRSQKFCLQNRRRLVARSPYLSIQNVNGKQEDRETHKHIGLLSPVTSTFQVYPRHFDTVDYVVPSMVT